MASIPPFVRPIVRNLINTMMQKTANEHIAVYLESVVKDKIFGNRQHFRVRSFASLCLHWPLLLGP